jgi:uncharacterized RDD family membrane protein YckC
MYCPYCSKEIAEDSLYCTFCGQHLFPGSQARAAGPAEPQAASSLGPLWSSPQEGSAEAPGKQPPAEAAVPVTAAAPPYTAPYAAAPRSAPATPPVRYAGFWRRFFAYVLDAIAINCVEGILIAFGVLRQMPAAPNLALMMKSAAITLPFVWLYFVLMESSPWQATLGKRALDLAVTDERGARVSFFRATGRFFGKLLSGIILGIGFIMAGLTAKKQALHDIISGCLVVRRAG